jgi:L-ascorbate metabolism protein UlaG (beta-lactamase superfamily)
VKDFGNVDIMLVCIGDRFTMGPRRAALAVKLVNPTMAIPIHFGTFALLTGTAKEFSDETKKVNPGTTVKVLEVGESFTWSASSIPTPSKLKIVQ